MCNSFSGTRKEAGVSVPFSDGIVMPPVADTEPVGSNLTVPGVAPDNYVTKIHIDVFVIPIGIIIVAFIDG